jgi:hypothetical protein
VRKAQAFAHGPADFDSGAYRDDGTIDATLFGDMLRNKQHPMSANWKLQEHLEIPLLRAVESHKQGFLAPYVL